MRNIELKVKADISKILDYFTRIKMIHTASLVQKDTYYLLGKMRLKIREEQNRNYIVYYMRKNDLESKDSKYFILGINNSFLGFTKKILNSILGTKRIIEKQRDLYIYRNTRIHLDRVKNLGEFLELETVVKDENNYAFYQMEQREVINLLGLDLLPKIAYSYSDLVKAN